MRTFRDRWGAFVYFFGIGLHFATFAAGPEDRSSNAPPVDHAEFTRLGYWQFDTPDWAGVAGQLPRAATNVQQVPSFDGSCLQVTNLDGLLVLSDTTSDRRSNFDLRNGSIRFWYKPYWTGTNRGGSGPLMGDAGLIEMGTYRKPGSNTNSQDGCLVLTTYYGGSAIYFAMQDNQGRDGSTGQAIPAACNAFISNQWHEIVLSFTPQAALLFINGVNIPAFSTTNGTGLPIPPPGVRAQGLTIGNLPAGGHPCQGAIDELETFNYPFGFIEANRNGWAMSATLASSPPAITLDWRVDPNLPRTVQRRLAGEIEWTALVTNRIGWRYRDTNVVPGQRYEYKIDPTGVRSGIPTNALWLLSGIDVPPVEYRGKAIVLVDQTLGAALALPLAQLQMDLVGDGWEVITNFVPRHNDTNPTDNAAHIAAIKTFITSTYRADPTNTKAVFILGHVAIPYSGFEATDGHSDENDSHRGAWPADAFYGDIDGNWTDNLSYSKYGHPRHEENTNAIGDGKWDQDEIPANGAGVAAIELAVGRVDFAKMPVFTSHPPSGVTAVAEVELLKRYLDKDHRFRIAAMPFRDRTLACDEFTPIYHYPDLNLWANAVRNGTRVFGFAAGTLIETDLFTNRLSAYWGLLSSTGEPHGVGYYDRRHYSESLAFDSNEPPVIVYLLSGSWFPDWNLTNNILRACLATPNYGLLAMSSLGVQWRFESLAMGDTFGDCLMRTVNHSGRLIPRHVALLGDPTLRHKFLQPPRDLTAATNLSGQLTLTWSGSSDPGVQYVVYRATAMTNRFSRLTAVPSSSSRFSDDSPSGGAKIYQVRSLARTVTASGSYLNFSEGIFKAVP
ncbi:MAG: hypothetical protein QOF48_798 [Verrucomicrobiota bacterium]|jgi:hypothetical protein